MTSCNLLILEEHLEVDTCQGSQRIKYEELILLNNIFHSAKNKIVQNYRSFSSWRHFFTYQSVTTSWEYVWLGTDLARAKPRNNQPRLDIDKQIASLRCPYGDGNENVKKQLVKISKTRRELPNFTFYRPRARDHTTTNLSYSLYTRIFFLRIQLWESSLT